MLCYNCGHEMDYVDDPMIEEYEGTTITVDGIGHWVCPVCGMTIIEASEATRLEEALESYAIDTGRYA